MKTRLFPVTFLFCAFFIFPALAEQPLEGRATYTRMYETAAGQYQAAFKKMNHSYQTLLDMLDNTGTAKLKLAQEAWQKYSAAECKFTTDYSRGEPFESIIYQDCLTNLTEERAYALDYQLRRNFTLDPSLASLKHKQ